MIIRSVGRLFASLIVRRAPRAPVLLTLLLLLCVSPATRAAESGTDTTADGWKKVFAYARCALEVWKAVTPADWTLAFLDCGHTFLDEHEPGAKP